MLYRKEDTMKSLNPLAAFPLRAVLAVAVVMFGVVRTSDFMRRATLTAFAAEQPALQWRQTSGPEAQPLALCSATAQTSLQAQTAAASFARPIKE